MPRTRKFTDKGRKQEQRPIRSSSSRGTLPISSADGRSSRQIFPLIFLAAGCLVMLESCATPITVGPDHFGVGLYQTQSHRVNAYVDYRKVEGTGILFTCGRVSLGYGEHELVTGKLDQCSYSVSTPLADFAVGKAAENAGLEYVFPNIPQNLKGDDYD